jgi:hypothetical protein
MYSKGVGAFRPIARAGVIASSLALLAMVLSPSAALGATVITTAVVGSPAGTMTCSAGTEGFSLVQLTPPTPGAYVVQADGTITSWRTQADALAIGPVGLQVWRLTTGQTYQLVGASPLVTLTPSSVNSFDLLGADAIAVQKGDVLGLRIQGDALCANASDGAYGGFGGPNPAKGAIVTFDLNPFAQLDVEATVTTVVTPPPPPPPPPSNGCDAQDQSGDGATDNAKHDSTDNAKHDSTDNAKHDSTDNAEHDSTDNAKHDSTDNAEHDSTDKAKHDSTGNDNHNCDE